LEVVVETPDEAMAGMPLGWAVVAHPHPLMGGTLDNKVVHTVARALVSERWAVIRFNFRGVGRSTGQWDEGRGEVDDMLAVWSAYRHDPRWSALPWALAGFSFGGHVANQAAARLNTSGLQGQGLVLVSPAVVSFATEPAVWPALVVQGDEDEVVPMAAVLAWAKPQTLPVTVVPGAGHFFHGHLGVLKQVVAQYVRHL
jgi:alpha/beta superfamily hydrolase